MVLYVLFLEIESGTELDLESGRVSVLPSKYWNWDWMGRLNAKQELGGESHSSDCVHTGHAQLLA